MKENKKLVYFNLVEEVVDTVGTFVLRIFFGEENAGFEETVKIYVNGREKSLPFPVAFREVFAQTMSKLASFPRLFLFDGLTDWCLTPFERTVRHN